MVVEGETLVLFAPHPDQSNVIIITARPIISMEEDLLHRQLSLRLVSHTGMVVSHPQKVATNVYPKSARKRVKRAS